MRISVSLIYKKLILELNNQQMLRFLFCTNLMYLRTTGVKYLPYPMKV